MRPFRLGQKVWEKATVTKRHDERSYQVESESGIYRPNRVDLREQSTPQGPLQQIPGQAPVVTPNKDQEKTQAEANSPPETSGANQQPNEQQPTSAAVPQRPKRTIREPGYLKDYLRQDVGTLNICQKTDLTSDYHQDIDYRTLIL